MTMLDWPGLNAFKALSPGWFKVEYCLMDSVEMYKQPVSILS